MTRGEAADRVMSYLWQRREHSGAAAAGWNKEIHSAALVLSLNTTRPVCALRRQRRSFRGKKKKKKASPTARTSLPHIIISSSSNIPPVSGVEGKKWKIPQTVEGCRILCCADNVNRVVYNKSGKQQTAHPFLLRSRCGGFGDVAFWGRSCRGYSKGTTFIPVMTERVDVLQLSSWFRCTPWVVSRLYASAGSI